MAKVDRNQEALKIAMAGLVTPVSPWRWVVVGSNNRKYSVCMMGENHYNCQCKHGNRKASPDIKNTTYSPYAKKYPH